MVEIIQLIEHESFPLTLKKQRKSDKNLRVYLGEKVIGMAHKVMDYPNVVSVFKIVTNKKKYYVATNAVEAYDYMEDDSSRYGQRKIEYAELQTRIIIANIELMYEDIKRLVVGQKIGDE